MISISIQQSLSTNLRPDYQSVTVIGIEDQPFAVGGFGEVYHVLSINNVAPPEKLVLKIFLDTQQGAVQHNYTTTQRLQAKLDDYQARQFAPSGASLEAELPGFIGAPQFSFKGTFKSTQVYGFAANDLSALGYHDFENVLSDPALLTRYQDLPLDAKLTLAGQLVACFTILGQFHYIHADLKPGALFVNIDEVKLAIIDFDSGVVVENSWDEPKTWGAANDWVAPEIWEQQIHLIAGEKIQVDHFTDRWSIAVAIHYLIATVHPLFYLTELSAKVTHAYFKQFQWPVIAPSFPYFEKANAAFYVSYQAWVSQIPAEISDRLSASINYGYHQPAARVTYNDWQTGLNAIRRIPVINSFTSTYEAIVTGLDLVLEWDIVHANEITIFPSVGDVSGHTDVRVAPVADTTYTISGKNFFGEVSQSLHVRVFPVPIMKTLLVPAPDLNSTIHFPSVQLTDLRQDFSVNLNVGLFEETQEGMVRKHPRIFQISKVISHISTQLNIQKI